MLGAFGPHGLKGSPVEFGFNGASWRLTAAVDGNISGRVVHKAVAVAAIGLGDVYRLADGAAEEVDGVPLEPELGVGVDGGRCASCSEFLGSSKLSGAPGLAF